MGSNHLFPFFFEILPEQSDPQHETEEDDRQPADWEPPLACCSDLLVVWPRHGDSQHRTGHSSVLSLVTGLWQQLGWSPHFYVTDVLSITGNSIHASDMKVQGRGKYRCFFFRDVSILTKKNTLITLWISINSIKLDFHNLSYIMENIRLQNRLFVFSNR